MNGKRLTRMYRAVEAPLALPLLMAVLMALLMSLLVSPLNAQRSTATSSSDVLPVTDSVRDAHRVHITPHLVVFDAQNRTTTLTVRNTGNTPTEADLVIELGYAAWQNHDTVLFSPHWQRETPYDTVVANPKPQDHYAGRWLSGLPTHLVLQPHQTKQLTLQITPPAGLPNGEYYARVITIVRPQHHDPSKTKDAKMIYTLPIRGTVAVAPLRDSVRVYYRQGPQTMGVTLSAKGAIDTTREGNDSAQARKVGVNPLRNLVHVHLTGTAHFEGYEEDYYVTPSGEHIPLTADISEGGLGLVLHTDGILRDLAQTDMLTRGHYQLVIRFIPRQDEFPAAQRLPMDTAQVAIPFDIP